MRTLPPPAYPERVFPIVSLWSAARDQRLSRTDVAALMAATMRIDVARRGPVDLAAFAHDARLRPTRARQILRRLARFGYLEHVTTSTGDA